MATNEPQRVLSDRDRDCFLAMLNAPAAPNDALRAAAADFKRAVQQKELVLRTLRQVSRRR